ncbi:MAG: hypothetical protein PHU46_12095 [Rhodocyclaceae bacterium]|nr:hypothetical protein [Rhodocyclaceae bacterium]
MKYLPVLLAGFCITSAGYAMDKVVINLDLSDTGRAIALLKPVFETAKDKFETTPNFHRRVCDAAFKAVRSDGKTQMTARLVHGEYESKIIYDPDKQIFIGTLHTVPHYLPESGKWEERWQGLGIDSSKFEAILLSRRYDENNKGYVGTNAYGVAKQVHVASEDVVVVFIPVRTSDYGKNVGYIKKISLPAKPDLARTLNGDLRLGVVTRIEAPCVVSATQHTSPTIGFPYDKTTYEIGLVGSKDAEWLIYRESTKEILKRGKFN